ncbi:MAG: hypothetical protein Greene041679_275 [Parcubacteria group bacterium Greene0416_79]|nr:MAG: hypothetical protein Greene041679_275 [Parcubacteria group bacterium Greene0416_79]
MNVGPFPFPFGLGADGAALLARRSFCVVGRFNELPGNIESKPRAAQVRLVYT